MNDEAEADLWMLFGEKWMSLRDAVTKRAHTRCLTPTEGVHARYHCRKYKIARQHVSRREYPRKDAPQGGFQPIRSG